MNELNFESGQSRYPAGIALVVPGAQASRLEDALTMVTRVLARYELADHYAKTSPTMKKNAADIICLAMLEANQEDLARAIKGSEEIIDQTYINEMSESFILYEKGETLDYNVLRNEAKLVIHAVSHLKDDVLEAIEELTSSVDVIQPFDTQPGMEEEKDLDFQY